MTALMKQPSALSADRNPALVYLSQLSPAGRAAQSAALTNIADMASGGRLTPETFPWHALEYQHTAAIRRQLIELYQPATVNRHLSALRRVLQEAWRLGLMDAERYQRAKDVANVKAEVLPAGRAISAPEVSALLQACDADAHITGIRDAAMIALLYAGGLRRAELCAMDAADYDRATGEIRVLHGKRQKQRVVFIGERAARRVNAWLDMRGYAPGSLLTGIDRNRNITHKRLSTQTVYDVLRRRSIQAGIEPLSPHDMRRTLITEMLVRGVDVLTVSNIAGHESTDTTRRYDRRGDDAKRKAAKVFDLPD